MGVLRVYDPSECDAAGVPLDWERCRTCDGEGYVNRWDNDENKYEDVPTWCPTCDRHGSLKAVALLRLRTDQWTASVGPEGFRSGGPSLAEYGVRCEDCGHPMADWSPDGRDLDLQLRELRKGGDLVWTPDTAWSPCDEQCRHSGALRFHPKDGEPWIAEPERDPLAFNPSKETETAGDVVRRITCPVEASWRQVDVRTLGWPHDLRPEKLAVLCLRCWSDRKGES